MPTPPLSPCPSTPSAPLPRDRLRAELRAEATNVDAGKLQQEINRRMSAALALAKATPGVAVETAGYTVYQERVGQTTRWHGSQSLRLNSADFAALLALAGKLQEQGLVFSALAAELSPEATQAVQDELTAAALARLQARAARIAAALDMRVERFREFHIGNAATPGPVMRAMVSMATNAPSPPVAEGGDAIVSLNVEATVALMPR